MFTQLAIAIPSWHNGLSFSLPFQSKLEDDNRLPSFDFNQTEIAPPVQILPVESKPLVCQSVPHTPGSLANPFRRIQLREESMLPIPLA